MSALLFVTCIVDQLYPEVGESTVRLLRRLGVDLEFPEGQTCCGQPAFNSGYWAEARPLARRWLEQFDRDRDIVVPSGSCASMVRVFYEELLHDDPDLLARARRAGQRVYELSEYIVDVLGVTDVSSVASEASDTGPLKATYHEACHLRRELGVQTQPRTLIASCPGVELVEMRQPEVCCGFGGTFSVKYPEISGAMLDDKVRNTVATGADAVVACDSSCLMQIRGGLERRETAVRSMHLAELLDGATGGRSLR